MSVREMLIEYVPPFIAAGNKQDIDHVPFSVVPLTSWKQQQDVDVEYVPDR